MGGLERLQGSVRGHGRQRVVPPWCGSAPLREVRVLPQEGVVVGEAAHGGREEGGVHVRQVPRRLV